VVLLIRLRAQAELQAAGIPEPIGGKRKDYTQAVKVRPVSFAMAGGSRGGFAGDTIPAMPAARFAGGHQLAGAISVVDAQKMLSAAVHCAGENGPQTNVPLRPAL